MLCSHIFHDAFDHFGLSLSRLALRFIFLEQAIEAVLNLDLGAALDLQAYLVPLAAQLLPKL